MNSVLLRRLAFLISPFCFAVLLLMFGGLFVAHADAITVTNTNDSGAGSLRQAIAAADSSDTIIFDESLSGLTVVLTSGQLELTKSLTIDGSGLADMVKISGDDSSRVFNVNEDITVTLSYMGIISGSVTGGSAGGGIVNEGTLYLLDSAVYGNSSNALGGGIANAPGSIMVIQDSTIMNNSALSGGGINNNGSITVTGSTIINNNALGGGGIVIWGGSLSLINSTLGDNSALAGGGLWAFDGSVYVNNSTFYTNSAFSGGSAYFQAGTLDMRNTILANSPNGSDCFIDDEVQINGNSNNLVADGGCSDGAENPVSGDPMLGPLADNGGATLTYRPLVGSPAIDAGDNPSCETKDQRGGDRPLDGDASGTAECDIGSVESSYEADITINKAPEVQELEVGETAAFTITVKNSGSFTLTNVSVSDPLVSGCDVVFATLGPADEEITTCEIANVTSSFTNEASVTGDVLGLSSNQVSDSDTADVSVVHTASITIQKNPTNQSIDYRDSAAFTIMVKNTGNITLVEVTVVDPLVPGCDVVYSTLAPGDEETNTCSAAGVFRSFTNRAIVTATVQGFPDEDVTGSAEAVVTVEGYFIHLSIIPKDYDFFTP